MTGDSTSPVALAPRSAEFAASAEAQLERGPIDAQEWGIVFCGRPFARPGAPPSERQSA